MSAAVALYNNNLLNASSNSTAMERNHTGIMMSSNSDVNANANANDNAKSDTICRVIAIDDEDSRECPSQGASEIARDDIYNLGIDARGGGGCPAQQTTKHVLYTMHNYSSRPFSQRVAGLRRHQLPNDAAFLERRDCNSFDSHDGK